MDAINVLVGEHRLISRMVALMELELKRAEIDRATNPAFIYSAVDFFKNYADRTHHGKEESILFRALAAKSLLPEDQREMAQLGNEHRIARMEVQQLLEAAQRYDRGDLDATSHIAAHLKRLIALYPPHIEREEAHFFPHSMAYFSEEEKKGMLEEFESHDAGMAHEKYVGLVEKYESP
jgi:hemerythrin-like domain-containing protein